MSRFELWPGAIPERRSFDLSEANPVHLLANDYPRARSPVFDMHYELEMGIVLRGRMRRHYAEDRVDVSRGDMWFCGMWEPHGSEVLRGRCRVVVAVIWPPLLASARFPEIGRFDWLAPFCGAPAGRPGRTARTRALALASAGRMLEAVRGGGEGAAFRLRLALFELLFEVTGGAARRARRAAAGPEAYGDISPALELALGSPALVTNDEAARTCAMSRDSFIRRFRELMGISFTKFALRHRLSRAAEELASDDMPVKAVAREWGFSDESHLHRLFSRYYGCSPAEYRRRVRG